MERTQVPALDRKSIKTEKALEVQLKVKMIHRS